jgi:hypothetical protein
MYMFCVLYGVKNEVLNIIYINSKLHNVKKTHHMTFLFVPNVSVKTNITDKTCIRKNIMLWFILQWTQFWDFTVHITDSRIINPLTPNDL